MRARMRSLITISPAPSARRSAAAGSHASAHALAASDVRKQCATARKINEPDMNAQDRTLQIV
jgi:hypothetical protein